MIISEHRKFVKPIKAKKPKRKNPPPVRGRGRVSIRPIIGGHLRIKPIKIKK